MNEKFNYSNVSSAMNSVMSEKDSAIQTLNAGTEYFDSALTSGSGDVAIAGASAEAMKAQWNELATRFAAFAKYIEQIDQLVQNASSNNVNLEDVVTTNSKAANN